MAWWDDLFKTPEPLQLSQKTYDVMQNQGAQDIYQNISGQQYQPLVSTGRGGYSTPYTVAQPVNNMVDLLRGQTGTKRTQMNQINTWQNNQSKQTPWWTQPINELIPALQPDQPLGQWNTLMRSLNPNPPDEYGWKMPEFIMPGMAKSVPGAIKGAVEAAPKVASQVPHWLGALGNWMGSHKLATAGLLGTGGLLAGNLWPRTPQAVELAPGVKEKAALQYILPVPPTDMQAEQENMGEKTIPAISPDGRFWSGDGGYTWQPLSGGGNVSQVRDEPDQMALLREQLAAQERIARMNNQSQLEQIQMQNDLARQREAASATQNMATMYASDPYKYWAQLGQLTPEAVAALTGGKVKPGEKFSGTPLSYPSMQWWNNLTPSEQEQILGVLNWMGINPEDWATLQQRMMPGLSSRQPSVSWAR